MSKKVVLGMARYTSFRNLEFLGSILFLGKDWVCPGIPGLAEPVELRWRSHDSLHPAYHAMLLTKSFFANFSVLLFVNTFSLSFSIFAH